MEKKYQEILDYLHEEASNASPHSQYETNLLKLIDVFEELINENQELKEKAQKYDELCKHNVMESQSFGDDLIQGILALNKRVIERNKKLNKALDLACERLDWDCPVGQDLIDDLDCENCDTDKEKKCWKKYFLKEVFGNEIL